MSAKPENERDHDGYGKCGGTGRVWVDDGQASNWYEGGSCEVCRRTSAKLEAMQRDAILARQTREPEPVALHDLADVFERPFTDLDDPRLRCAKVLTHAEAEAVLEHSGDLVAALSNPAEAQARVEALEAAVKLAVDLVERDVIRVRPSEREEMIEALTTWNALLSGSTPKPARVEIDEEMVERLKEADQLVRDMVKGEDDLIAELMGQERFADALKMDFPITRRMRSYCARFAALTAALSTAPAKDGEAG